jgi:phenylacetate-CoA ligase
MTVEELLYQYRMIYYDFPQSLKIFLGSLYGNIPLSIRFGEGYNSHTKIIQKFENANEQYKLDFMYNKTLETLLFAEKNIPYYKDIFNKYGISSKSFKSLDDINLFPLLTKNDIKKNLDKIYTQKIEKTVSYYSGGSLSTPTKFFLPVSTRAKEKAYNNYIFSKIKYQHRDKSLLLKGREIVNVKKDIFWEYEPVENFFLLSTNYLNSEKFSIMYTKVKEFKPRFLIGYPSAVLSFIKQSKLYNLNKLDIAGVILTSETIYKDELQSIQEYFGVDVLTHYGHTERNIIGYRINRSMYNFMNSYGLVREKNSELITTTFDNFTMPFINYKSGDSVVGSINHYETTDIIKEVENIEGRTQDYLVTKDKRLISITSMYYNRDKLFEQVNAIQYIQEKIGEVTVLIESTEINPKVLEKTMNQNLAYKGLDITVHVVQEIKKSARGKRIVCIQKLDIDNIKL